MAENLQIVIGAKDEFSGTFARLQNMLPRMRTLIIAAAGAVAGATTAIGAMVKTTATAHDEVQKFSDQLGISTEFISRMQVAAEFSGVEVETMRKAIQRLQVGIGEANRGIGLSKDAFNDLGITLRGTSGELKTSEELMPELAEKLAGVTSATERAELASKLFGQRGISMIQILGKGKDSLEAMWKEADQLGLTVGSVAAKQAAEFNDSLTRVKGALTGVKNTIAEAL
ncbi:MAG: hypothetical protein ABIJ57_11530, partial [Pseudomonadota bacterium]